MSKLLRVLVILLLLLSIGAVTLGTMLFIKREILKGRTQKLETAIIALGGTIEAEPAQPSSTPQFTARDVSPVTSELLPTPELSDFWDKYQYALELPDQPTVDVGKRRLELMNYYKIDQLTGKPAKDPATGLKITTGEGTMQAVLDDLHGKAEEQLNRLNTTRQQLKDLRIELVSAINELNALKQNHRQALKTIEDLEAEIRRLKDRIAQLESQVARLEEEKRRLEDEISEKNRTIADLEQTVQDKNQRIETLQKRIDELESVASRQPKTPGGETAPQIAVNVRVEPGEKGQVVAVNPQWNFVIIKLSDEFLAEVLPKDAAAVPAVELMIKRRTAGEEKFVTKVRLVQIKSSEKLGVADILPDWQQDTVKKGDIAFF